jgi:formylglycine-generating enzyme required for sulfatase activity
MEELIHRCLPTYEVVGKIGEGVFGSIYKVRDRFKERAVKIVPLQAERTRSCPSADSMRSQISRDFHAVREYYEAVKGDGVVEIYDFFLLEPDCDSRSVRAHLLILMEYCPENLNDFILDRFPLASQAVKAFLRDLAGILHRLSRKAEGVFVVTDLKPTNLLIDARGKLVIGDLGGFKRIRSVSTVTGAQYSPSWCAPEIVLQGAAPDVPAIVYAYGLVAYFMWEGCLPHETFDFSERFERIRQEGLPFLRPDIPTGIRALIRRCLRFRPSQRYGGFRQVVEGLDSLGSVDPAAGKRVCARQPSQNDGPQTVSDGDVTKPAPPIDNARFESSEPDAVWIEPHTKMVFVWVPDGSYRMGALPGDPDAAPDESPQLECTVVGFWMGRHPVTQQQWKLIMGNNPSHFRRADDHPVEQIRFGEALAFARRLSERSGNRLRFRLPSEMQWEFAARSGGRNERFSGGKDVDAVAWYRGNSGLSPQPVETRAPNGLGLFDMSGNVLEWCSDLYRSHLRSAASPVGTIGTDTGLRRVCRGGSWRTPAVQCRTTARKGIPQGLRYTDLGLRLVREK